jgi:hypothetical protein
VLLVQDSTCTTAGAACDYATTKIDPLYHLTGCDYNWEANDCEFRCRKDVPVRLRTEELSERAFCEATSGEISADFEQLCNGEFKRSGLRLCLQ